MFDIGSSELLMVAVVAIVVIGPKDLPRALYKLGQIVAKARSMSRHFRSGIDAMVREVEMEEMEKKWAEQNRQIMSQYPDATNADHSAGHTPQSSFFDDVPVQEAENPPAADSTEAVKKPTSSEGSAA